MFLGFACSYSQKSIGVEEVPWYEMVLVAEQLNLISRNIVLIYGIIMADAYN